MSRAMKIQKPTLGMLAGITAMLGQTLGGMGMPQLAGPAHGPGYRGRVKSRGKYKGGKRRFTGHSNPAAINPDKHCCTRNGIDPTNVRVIKRRKRAA